MRKSHAIEKAVIPKLATECASLSFDPVDKLQLSIPDKSKIRPSEAQAEGSGVFSEKVDKIRLVLSVVVEDESKFAKDLKKLPKNRKSYQRNQIRLGMDKAVEPATLLDILFGGRQLLTSSNKETQEEAKKREGAEYERRKRRLTTPSISTNLKKGNCADTRDTLTGESILDRRGRLT